MNIAELMQAMEEAGAPLKAIMIAVKAIEDERVKAQEKRERAAAQKREQRARGKNQMSVSGDSPETVCGLSADASPYKDNHASAPVSSNGSSLRSEPELITPLPSVGPQTAEKPKRTTGGCLPEDWAPSEKLFAYGRKQGLSDEQSAAIFENMRLWARSNRNRAIARKADWDDAMMGAIRRDAPKILASRARAGPPKATTANPWLNAIEDICDERDRRLDIGDLEGTKAISYDG